MSRENYYILLELPLEPPENDKDRIERVIEEKRRKWSEICRNAPPTRARMAEVYLEMLPDIKKIMSDDHARREEAEKAIIIIRRKEKEKFQQIDEAIKLVSLGGSITHDEISELSRILSVDETVVRKRVTVPIVEAKVVERLDPSLYSQITGNLQTIEKESLYDFLGVPADSRLDDLRASAEKIAADIRTDSNKDTKLTARQVLIGHCRDLFKSEEKRRRYDASLAYQSLDELNKYIDIAGINGAIRVEAFDFLMEKAVAMGIKAPEAEEHILAYCEEKKWRVRIANRAKEIMEPCAHCGAMNTPGATNCASCGKPPGVRHHKHENIDPFANNGTPIIPYGISKVLIGLAGIILSLISAIPLLKIFITLLKGKSYIGNGPYLAATVLSFSICAVISVWGLKTLLSGHKEIKEYRLPVPTAAEIFGDIEDVFTKKQVQPHQTALEHMLGKDKTFIKGFLVFMGVVILFFIAKIFLPDDFFWNLRLTPQYFSFPFFITIILAAAAALRYASIYFHRPFEKQEIKGCVIRETIKTKADPDTFAPGIKEALIPVQQDGKPNMTLYNGLNETGKIQGKLFVETHPRPIPFVRPSFIYLYSSFAVILTVIGFLLMTKLPPDNISVLTVPTIAIGYIWSIIKGGLLVSSGAVFLTDVSRLYRTSLFKSIMAYVEITGEKDRSAYDFNVFTAALCTEMNTINGNRQIIKMTADQGAENSKKLVKDAIESFGD